VRLLSEALELFQRSAAAEKSNMTHRYNIANIEVRLAEGIALLGRREAAVKRLESGIARAESVFAVAGMARSLLQGMLGPDLGKHTLQSALGGGWFYYLLTFVFGLLLVGIAFLLHKIERKKNYNWLFAGIGLAILNCIAFLHVVFNKPIGASSTYPYLGNLFTDLFQNNSIAVEDKSGKWQLIFLAGAMLSGLVISLLRKDFKIKLIYSGWSKTQGKSSLKRILWAFIGGFIMLLGARMAGGCTSGHVISGGMQIAASSLLFGAFVFAGLLITGKYFYRKS
jgi:uncharacterized membrane protein YedE/YeeE